MSENGNYVSCRALLNRIFRRAPAPLIQKASKRQEKQYACLRWYLVKSQIRRLAPKSFHLADINKKLFPLTFTSPFAKVYSLEMRRVFVNIRV